ncbi:MAG: AI-2E family transporter [Chthoniobacterales bacterium]
MRKTSSSASDALVGIWAILLISFVIAVLSVGKEILVPIALAALITFLLAPVVGWLEDWIGRIAAVLLVVLMVFSLLGGAGWILTRQVIDLAAKLPNYQANISVKMRALRMPSGGTFTRFSKSMAQLQTELADPSPAPESMVLPSEPQDVAPKPATAPLAVKVVDSESRLARLAETTLSGVLSPLGTAALVLLLVIFMLLKREDLRGRMIRLIGQGRISATTRAMDDAGDRVARYLMMQLLVNVVYGSCVATGLYFIGVPNAALWGVLCAVLRFIPYVGPWIGAALPLAISFAVSTSWAGPILTLGMFLTLELVNANAVEPWLYGTSTGVSSIALIVAAVFWTWLWGPIGLLLSTPLTVCLAVMGRHVPKLEFLSVLLSEERALTLDEECYHRLLAGGPDDASELADTYLRDNSLTSLYDSVIIPVITSAEVDVQRKALQPEERATLLQNVQDVIEDFATRPLPESKLEADIAVAQETPEFPTVQSARVLCLPARAQRDEIAGQMLTQLLRQQGFEAENAPAELGSDALVELAGKTEPEAICISVVAPSTSIQARFLTAKLRKQLPHVKILVGFWGATEKLADTALRLRNSGADEVVTSLANAVVQLAKFAVPIEDDMEEAPIAEDEEARLAELLSLNLLEPSPDKVFDRATAKLAKIFQVPIVLVTFIDRDRQWFKSQVGLPEDLARERSTPRSVSVCGHVVSKNNILVVEDLARDRRFANNPLLKSRGLRFYAGVPLRGPSGRAIGSLCLLDTKPRKMSEHDRRLLEVFADDLSDEIKSRAPEKLATPAPVEATTSEAVSAVPAT